MPGGPLTGPSRSVPGTVAEVLDDLAVTAELSLRCAGRHLQLSADGHSTTLTAPTYRDLFALRHRPPGGFHAELAHALGARVDIVVHDRHVATVRLGVLSPWWQRLVGMRTHVSINWLNALRSVIAR